MGDTTDGKLGKHLRRLRTSRKLTARQAAELAGITQGYLSQIENGVHIPSARTISKLARAYGIPEVELLLTAGVIHELVLRSSEDRDGLDPVDPEIILPLEGTFDRILRLTREAMAPPPDECYLPLFNSNGSALNNADGQPIAVRLPQAFCNEDPQAFVLEVEDEHLSPLVLPGDWVLVSPQTSVQPDEIAVLHDGMRFSLRKYAKLGGMVGFHASSTRYPSWTPQDLLELGLTIVGRAMRVINRELNRLASDQSSSQVANT